MGLRCPPSGRVGKRAYVLGVPEKAELLRWAERLRTFDRPALVIWATEDRVMPLDYGRRLAALLPQGRLVEVADSYTLIPQDRPDALVEHIGAFLAETVREVGARLPRGGAAHVPTR